MYRLNMVDYRLMVKNAQKNGNHYAWQWARPDEVSHSGPRRSMTNLHFSLLYASRDRHNHNSQSELRRNCSFVLVPWLLMIMTVGEAILCKEKWRFTID